MDATSGAEATPRKSADGNTNEEGEREKEKYTNVDVSQSLRPSILQVDDSAYISNPGSDSKFASSTGN